MVMRVTGKAAHSGGNFKDGISAIEELAHKIVALHALTDLDRGTTPQRRPRQRRPKRQHRRPLGRGPDRPPLRRARRPRRRHGPHRAIIERSTVPGTKTELDIRGEFLPLTQTPAAKRLFDLYVDSAAASGLAIAGEFSGGCADSGFTAGVGTPTILLRRSRRR